MSFMTHILAKETISEKIDYFFIVIRVILNACHQIGSQLLHIFYGGVLRIDSGASEPEERGCSAVRWYGTKSKLSFCPLGMPQSTKKLSSL